eukprot:560804-Amphidinium_carterae.1
MSVCFACYGNCCPFPLSLEYDDLRSLAVDFGRTAFTRVSIACPDVHVVRKGKNCSGRLPDKWYILGVAGCRSGVGNFVASQSSQHDVQSAGAHLPCSVPAAQ